MITSIFFNLILIAFPIFCYFFYMIYSKVSFSKEKDLFFDFALFTSYYLCIKFGNITLKNMFILNLPLFLALINNRKFTYFILSLLISLSLQNISDIMLYSFVIQYLTIFICSKLLKSKETIIYISCGIIFFLLNVFLFNLNIDLYNIVLFNLLFSLIIFLTYLFNKKANDIIKSYNTLTKLTKEKQFYESLFKVTHEIKNPLAVCKGYLDMFDANNINKSKKYIGIINQEINRTLELLKDFSCVSKAINIKCEKVDISMLVDDVSDEMKFISNKNIKFNCQNMNKAIYIKGDYDRLKQVLINIIKNSKEAIERQGEIILKLEQLKNYVSIIVKDNGCGFDFEEGKSVGKPFYTTKKNGTGLGVCFSKEIIEKHNGSINYYSKKNIGTTVKIILPIEKAS